MTVTLRTNKFMCKSCNTAFLCLQTRLGSWLTWLSVAAALLSLTGGTFGCVSLIALWWATRGSSPAPAKGNYGMPAMEDDSPPEEDDSDDELASQGDIDGQ